MRLILLIAGIALIAILTVVWFVRRGRMLSRDQSLLPQPGMFDAERDRKFREEDEQNHW